MLRTLRFLTSACVMMALAAVLSFSLAGRPPRPTPQIRTVFVTDSHCGVEGLDKRNRHGETLACVAKGAHLQLFDRNRNALYEIQYVSEELRIELTNDYAGLDVNAEGLWDDTEYRVKLRKISPFRDPGSRQYRELE
jgi:hypothetical protein